MDDPRFPNGPGGPSMPGPQWRQDPPAEGFVPLRLRLEATGAAVELTAPDMLVGRHSEADLRLPLPDVSRRHCRFRFHDGRWWLHDLHSLNGVYVNGQRVEHVAVGPGDTVRIGGFTFLLETPASGDHGPGRNVLRSIADALPHSAEDSSRQRRAS